MENKNLQKSESDICPKFKVLTENVDFMEKILESKTEKEVRNLFEKEGLTLSDKDVQYLSEAISKTARKTAILPEEELSTVAGGISTIGTEHAFKRGMDYSDSWWNTSSAQF